MRVTVIQHVPFEGPAVIGDVLRDQEIRVDVVRMDLGRSVPSAGSMDALVVMGGPMGAFDDSDHPHLPAERDLIAECASRGTPVLGVCLGAQLLAASLGGKVYRGPTPEVGLGTVRLTEDGRRDRTSSATRHRNRAWSRRGRSRPAHHAPVGRPCPLRPSHRTCGTLTAPADYERALARAGFTEVEMDSGGSIRRGQQGVWR